MGSQGSLGLTVAVRAWESAWPKWLMPRAFRGLAWRVGCPLGTCMWAQVAVSRDAPPGRVGRSLGDVRSLHLAHFSFEAGSVPASHQPCVCRHGCHACRARETLSQESNGGMCCFQALPGRAALAVSLAEPRPALPRPLFLGTLSLCAEAASALSHEDILGSVLQPSVRESQLSPPRDGVEQRTVYWFRLRPLRTSPRTRFKVGADSPLLSFLFLNGHHKPNALERALGNKDGFRDHSASVNPLH